MTASEGNPETNPNILNKCPHCQCCFCTEADLKRHIEAMGSLKAEHFERFRNTHGRLEHSGFGGPE
jgi:hypothetical protein